MISIGLMFDNLPIHSQNVCSVDYDVACVVRSEFRMHGSFKMEVVVNILYYSV